MTLEQPTLLGDVRTIIGGRELRPRQQIAWDMVRNAPSGVDADEVGAALHERKGKHPADHRCRWCPDEGKSVLGSVALKTLVTRKRATGRWHPRNEKDAVSRAHSHAGGVIATSQALDPSDPFYGL